jgi:hypothetical protein
MLLMKLFFARKVALPLNQTLPISPGSGAVASMFFQGGEEFGGRLKFFCFIEQHILVKNFLRDSGPIKGARGIQFKKIGKRKGGEDIVFGDTDCDVEMELGVIHQLL